MSNQDQLEMPPAVKVDANSFEILRVWVATNQQHMSIRTDVWDDPAAWGIMLADLARHVANSYHDEHGLDTAETLIRIKAGIDVELNQG